MIAQACPMDAPDAGTSAPYLIGDVSVTLRSDLAVTFEQFGELYRGYPRGTASMQPPIRMHVLRARTAALKRDRYVVIGNDEAIGKERRRDEVLPFLEWGINYRVISTYSNFLQLHAASMVRDGRGVILAGTSGCGKSTLAAGMLVRGWQYLSDEFALIDRRTLRLHPFPKAICIKSGSFGVVQRLGLTFAGRRFYVKGIKGTVGYVNPFDVAVDPIASPSPVRFVVFPKYAEGMRTRLYPISRARAAFMLSGSTLNRHAFDDLGLTMLTAVVRDVECYVLESGALRASCDLIDSLVESNE